MHSNPQNPSKAELQVAEQQDHATCPSLKVVQYSLQHNNVSGSFLGNSLQFQGYTFVRFLSQLTRKHACMLCHLKFRVLMRISDCVGKGFEPEAVGRVRARLTRMISRARNHNSLFN